MLNYWFYVFFMYFLVFLFIVYWIILLNICKKNVNFVFVCIFKGLKNFDVSFFFIIYIFYLVLLVYNDGCVNEKILYLFRKL